MLLYFYCSNKGSSTGYKLLIYKIRKEHETDDDLVNTLQTYEKGNICILRSGDNTYFSWKNVQDFYNVSYVQSSDMNWERRILNKTNWYANVIFKASHNEEIKLFNLLYNILIDHESVSRELLQCLQTEKQPYTVNKDSLKRFINKYLKNESINNYEKNSSIQLSPVERAIKECIPTGQYDIIFYLDDVGVKLSSYSDSILESICKSTKALYNTKPKYIVYYADLFSNGLSIKPLNNRNRRV